MDGFAIDASEVTRLAKELGDAAAPKQKEARAAVQGIARQVKSRAQAAAPRDRPWLATTGIHTKTWNTPQGVHVDIFTGMDERGVNVGFYAEYGTADTPPQPFLTPQAGWAAGEVEQALTRIVDPFEQGNTTELGDG